MNVCVHRLTAIDPQSAIRIYRIAVNTPQNDTLIDRQCGRSGFNDSARTLGMPNHRFDRNYRNCLDPNPEYILKNCSFRHIIGNCSRCMRLNIINLIKVHLRVLYSSMDYDLCLCTIWVHHHHAIGICIMGPTGNFSIFSCSSFGCMFQGFAN